MLNLIMLDIDYFRQYKDTYGHLVGNQAFHVAKRISDSMLQQRVEDREHQAVPVPTASQGIAVFPTEVQEISVSWIWQTGADMWQKNAAAIRFNLVQFRGRKFT